MRTIAVFACFAGLLAACSDDGPADVPGPRPGLDGTVAQGGGRGGASGAAGSPSGGGAAGASGSDPVGGASGAAGSEGGEATAPDAASVNAFLQTRAYRAWPSESTDHVSAGPHGGTVRVFLNPTLDASFAAGNATHPAGSIAVKELYQDGKPAGFAYSTKLSADSAGGDEWYWYEVFTDEAASTAPYAGKGIGLCKNCHAGGGRDFVLISYPLR